MTLIWELPYFLQNYLGIKVRIMQIKKSDFIFQNSQINSEFVIAKKSYKFLQFTSLAFLLRIVTPALVFSACPGPDSTLHLYLPCIWDSHLGRANTHKHPMHIHLPETSWHLQAQWGAANSLKPW